MLAPEGCNAAVREVSSIPLSPWGVPKGRADGTLLEATLKPVAELLPGLLVAELTNGSCSSSQWPCLYSVISFSDDFPFHAGNDRISLSDC